MMPADWQPTAAQLKAQDRTLMRIFWVMQAAILLLVAVSGTWWFLVLDVVVTMFVVIGSLVRR